MWTCACAGEGCDWLTHSSDGTRCGTTCAQDAVPFGWERSVDGRGYICPSCVLIRSLRAKGPLGPAPFRRNGSVGI